MNEKRKNNRWNSIKIIYLFKQGSQESIVGYLENISLDGIRLTSEKAIPIEEDFQICIEVESDKIKLEARSVWVEKDAESNFYYTGFKFTQLTPQVKKQIQYLINEQFYH